MEKLSNDSNDSNDFNGNYTRDFKKFDHWLKNRKEVISYDTYLRICHDTTWEEEWERAEKIIKDSL
jgi:hypothetical protein